MSVGECLRTLTKSAETSLFEAELPHHSAALRSVLPPEPDPLAERCDPRVFASVSHTNRLKRRCANFTVFKGSAGTKRYCIIVG